MDASELIIAAQNKLQVTLNYQKKTTGEVVTHTGGIYEIAGDLLWLWDTERNDTIRKFLLSNVLSYQILSSAFFPPQPWPIKINGEIVG